MSIFENEINENNEDSLNHKELEIEKADIEFEKINGFRIPRIKTNRTKEEILDEIEKVKEEMKRDLEIAKLKYKNKETAIKKDISINGFMFELNYLDKDTKLELINDINCYNIITITFIPKDRISEYEGNFIMENNKAHFLREINKVLIANQSFYQNFNFSNNFSGGGCSLANEFNQKILIKMDWHFDLKLKL